MNSSVKSTLVKMELAVGSFNIQGNFAEERLENIVRAGAMDAPFFSEPRHVGSGDPYRHASGQGMSFIRTNLEGMAHRHGFPYTNCGVIPTLRAGWVTFFFGVLSKNYMYISVYLPTSGATTGKSQSAASQKYRS